MSVYSAEYTDAATLTVTAGSTSQQVFAKNIHRKALLIQNPVDASESLFVNFLSDAGATNGSIELGSGGTLNMPQGMVLSMQKVSVTAVTTGHRFIAKEGV
jgi:hypothetical protein